MDQGSRTAPRRVRRRVHATDRVAGLVISAGGFVVIAAVLGICVYLACVVAPLFSRGELGPARALGADVRAGEAVLDPYGVAMAVVTPEGAVEGVLLDGGGRLGGAVDLGGHAPVTALAVARNGELVATGHEDGSVRLGRVGFGFSTAETDRSRPVGEVWLEGGAAFRVTEPGRARRTELRVEMGEPVMLGAGAGRVERVDYRVDPTGRTVLLAVRADGTALVNTVRTIRPLGGGAARTRLASTAFSLGDGPLARWSFVTADGQHVLLVDEDGTVERWTRTGEGFARAERTRGAPEGTGITAAAMLLGGQTLLVGDAAGTVRAWHVATVEGAGPDGSSGRKLVRSHEIAGASSAVVDLAPSVRDRSVTVLGADGRVRVRHVTSEKLVAAFDAQVAGARAARLTPKNDGVVVFGAGGAEARALDAGYPEFSLKALFGRVHYEGQAGPSYVYQSSSGDDSSEVKLSLVPLIAGSLKATVFAMLFAAPMGVLAAVYTSEFLSARVRRVVKPGVEIMASLPSVVLGFVAAMVVAPFVRAWLPSVLVGMATVPVAVLAVSHLWQLVPMRHRERLRSGQHLGFVLAACGLGLALAVWLGGPFERLLFAPPGGGGGPVDMRRWLAGEYGAGWPGWAVVLFGPAAVAVTVGQALVFGRRIDRMLSGRSAAFGAWFVLGRFLVVLGAACGLALGGALGLQALGFDPRDSVFGPFSPRNTLVVAIIMGFAVIPIIYTISEDALRAVPDSLRAASLGAGATPWQTAVRVVLPVAASGIFSACMIGFGRAVGETMIVLMATGNTPEMSWNIFGGFRTLSANIAVELPEAPQGGTHYRVLFLCGLVLFVMTFVINTLAEVVRQVVRARTAGL